MEKIKIDHRKNLDRLLFLLSKGRMKENKMISHLWEKYKTDKYTKIRVLLRELENLGMIRSRAEKLGKHKRVEIYYELTDVVCLGKGYKYEIEKQREKADNNIVKAAEKHLRVEEWDGIIRRN